MSRGLGEITFVQEVFPPWAAAVAGLLTQFGDAWFLLVLVGTVFLVAEQHRLDMIALFGVIIGATGLYRGLKQFFALPRPALSPLAAESIHPGVEFLLELTATASSYGFPSGHATGATVVYLGLASVLTVGTQRKRFAAAAGLIGLIATTRVVLAVHYLVDVLAGVAVGSAFVALVFVLPRNRVPASRVQVAYASAVATCGFYVLTSGANLESLLLLGLTLVVLAGWLLAAATDGKRLRPTG